MSAWLSNRIKDRDCSWWRRTRGTSASSRHSTVMSKSCGTSRVSRDPDQRLSWSGREGSHTERTRIGDWATGPVTSMASRWAGGVSVSVTRTRNRASSDSASSPGTGARVWVRRALGCCSATGSRTAGWIGSGPALAQQTSLHEPLSLRSAWSARQSRSRVFSRMRSPTISGLPARREIPEACQVPGGWTSPAVPPGTLVPPPVARVAGRVRAGVERPDGPGG
jgi:hypothetical protein